MINPGAVKLLRQVYPSASLARVSSTFSQAKAEEVRMFLWQLCVVEVRTPTVQMCLLSHLHASAGTGHRWKADQASTVSFIHRSILKIKELES